MYEKDYVWNPSTCNCDNGKYLTSIMCHSVIMRDEIIDTDAEAKSNDEAKPNNNKNKNKF